MCVYKISNMKAGKEMNYTIERIGENKAVVNMENGVEVTIIFRKEDNTDIEDIVTNNLMMSYEQRIAEISKSHDENLKINE